MFLFIDQRLEIGTQMNREPDFLSNDGRLCIYGRLFGAYDGEKTYNKSQAIEYLDNNKDNLSRVIEFIRYCVGQVIISIHSVNEIHFICSQSSHGFYYTKKDGQLIISDDEEIIFKYADCSQLNMDEVFSHVFTGHTSPFTTIVNNIRRVCSGTMLTISKGLNVSLKVYVTRRSQEICSSRRYSDSENYRRLIQGMEATAKVIVENCSDDIYIMVSGIDSVTWLIAFSKVAEKSRIHPLLIDQKSSEDIINDEVCRILGLSLTKIPFWSDSLPAVEDGRMFFSSAFYGTLHNLIPSVADYFIKNRIKSPLVISGNAAADLYVVTGRLKPVGSIFRLYSIRTVPMKQIRLTGLYQNLLVSGRLQKVYQLLKRGHPFYKYNISDYLLSLIVAPAHVIFSYETGFDNVPVEFSKYLDFKRKLVNDFLAYANADGDLHGKKISVVYLNHLMKSLHYIDIAACFPTRKINYKESKFEYMQPSLEGFMADYWMNYQPQVKDAFNVKRYLYKYFKRNCGLDYITFVYSAARRYPLNKSTLLYRVARVIRDIIARRIKRLFRAEKPMIVVNMGPNVWDMLDRQLLTVSKEWREMMGKSDSILLRAVNTDYNYKRYFEYLFDKFVSKEHKGQSKGSNLITGERKSMEMLVTLEKLLSLVKSK